MSGSVGQLTFKRMAGRTVVSEKVSTVTNRRTSAQQKHRMKWPNLIRMYSGVSPLLNCAFEKKSSGISDYNMFVKTNFAASKVYLTKSETASMACVAAPYQITAGSLDTVTWDGEPGASVTNIKVGSLNITDTTTVKELSNAVVLNNAEFNYGEQISFIIVRQEKHPITGFPMCRFKGECIVLDKNSDVKVYDIVSKEGFSVSNGRLACSLGSNFQGAYAWVHSSKESGQTLVSTQVMTVKNDLYDEYSSEAAYQRAVKTYGGENDDFLTPNDTAKAIGIDDDTQDNDNGGDDNGGSTAGGGTSTGGGDDF